MPEQATAGTYDADDYWGQVITLMTGFPLPARSKLFDNLKGNDDIKLFSVRIEQISPVRAVLPGEYGWQVSGDSDFDIVFYERSGQGREVIMRKAKFDFIRTDGGVGRADLLDPNERMGADWPLDQYVAGPINTLDALLSPPSFSTRGFQSNGLPVPDAQAVDLNSFRRSAEAFDRAKQFFVDQATVLADWEDRMGGEQAPWRGQAAGVVWELIHQLRRNYDSYAEQMGGSDYHASHSMLGGYTPVSEPGAALAHAQSVLVTHLESLRTAWYDWTRKYFHDPHRVLLESLVNIANWVISNNATQILTVNGQTVVSGTGANMDGPDSYVFGLGFSQNHPHYGELGSMGTWKKVGEEAVQGWYDRADVVLGTAARDVIVGLKTDWVSAGDDFDGPLRTVNRDTPSDFLQQDEADAATADAEAMNKNLQNIGDGFDSLNENVSSLGTGLNDGLDGLGTSLNDGLGGLGTSLNDGLGGLGTNPNDGLGNSPGGLLNPGGDLPLMPGVGSPLNPDTGRLTGGLTNRDGSVTELNPDGSLTTTYPDGTVTTLNPSLGTVTTTRPGGSATTTDLADGSLVNPDGSVTVAHPDGTVTTTHPDGTVTSLDPDTGVLTALNPDGTLTATYPDGGSTTVDPDTGLATTTGPDGSTTTADLHNGPLHAPDGSTITLDPDTGALTTSYPDGSSATLDPHTGTLTTTHPDGTVTTLNPNTGTLTTTKPDGSTVTTDLNGPSLPSTDTGTGDPSGLNDGLHLPSDLNTELPDFTGGGVPDTGDGGYGSLNDGLDADGAGNGYEDPYFDGEQDPGQAGRGIGSPAAAAPAGVPLNQGLGGYPMGPGMGMPGMGGGGGQGGNSERTRNVFTGSGGASITSRRNNRPAALDDEDVVITRGRTATSSATAFAPAGTSEAGKQRTESASQARTSWVTEDEDTWGTEEGGAPAVIGR
jgi:hypothetical protein